MSAVPGVVRTAQAPPPLPTVSESEPPLHAAPAPTSGMIGGREASTGGSSGGSAGAGGAGGRTSGSGRSGSTQPRSDEPHIGRYRLLKTIGKGNFAKVLNSAQTKDCQAMHLAEKNRSPTNSSTFLTGRSASQRITT
ncbi:MAP/microtubule affinity-regulating kinase 3-like [Tropilaelaps mercedesae]|uniref:MAP/microtubule affinity-regulating kinase 3-like n=1 Tax=Tropilaelaps mercedesae TaxID=418985 RepID=A0A1V9X7F2_9ACAR|nr:MAP/microtubule affinity-regulating kinase 3-like [Tropilaelaps mercedesae]